jgi:hypothetical protein
MHFGGQIFQNVAKVQEAATQFCSQSPEFYAYGRYSISTHCDTSLNLHGDYLGK